MLRDLRGSDGRLLRSWKDGEGKLNAYLEDHAYLLEALLTLYEASFEPRWFGEARALADSMIERFADPEHGGFFETSADHEELVARRKDLEDHPIPSGNASAAYGLLRLAALTGEHSYEEHAVSVLRLVHELARKHPQAFGHLLQALDFHLSPVKRGGAGGRGRAAARAGGSLRVPAAPGARGRRGRRRAAARPALPGGWPPSGLRVRALRLQGARDRAGGARTAALLASLALALAPAAMPAAAGAASSAHDHAVRISSWGPRPAASAAERRAHDYMGRVFRRARLDVSVQHFAVPGRGRSRNVIADHDGPRSCLHVVMAHTDTTPNAPGANDNASGLGVLAALAGRLGSYPLRCDVRLVATGAEERVYTGSPDHLGALALARAARRDPRRLRWALSLDEVGRDRPFWLRSPVGAPRRGVEGALLRAARRAGVPVSWVRDESTGNSDHREFELLGLPAAKLGVGAGGEPCRHSPCDRPARLDPRSLSLGPATG